MTRSKQIFFDAGLFIGALLRGDPRHQEARPLVEAARSGDLAVATTVGILSEVYAALTWVGAQPRQSPAAAARAVRLLVDPPSCLSILPDGLEAAIRMLELAETHSLTARRIHDARHAAIALSAGVSQVYTYDVDDWKYFAPHGLKVTGPQSMTNRL